MFNELHLFMMGLLGELRTKLPLNFDIIYKRTHLDINRDKRPFLCVYLGGGYLMITGQGLDCQTVWLRREIVNPDFDPDEVFQKVLAVSKNEAESIPY